LASDQLETPTSDTPLDPLPSVPRDTGPHPPTQANSTPPKAGGALPKNLFSQQSYRGVIGFSRRSDDRETAYRRKGTIGRSIPGMHRNNIRVASSAGGRKRLPFRCGSVFKTPPMLSLKKNSPLIPGRGRCTWSLPLWPSETFDMGRVFADPSDRIALCRPQEAWDEQMLLV
jgi:hypothetical protein